MESIFGKNMEKNTGMRRAWISAMLLAGMVVGGFWIAQTHPRFSLRSSSPAQIDALDALRGLQSVTEVGVSHLEYSRRVLDAKIRVDRYRDSTGADDPLRAKIAAAMRLHAIALSTWGQHIRHDLSPPGGSGAEIVLGDPAMAGIPAMAERIDLARKELKSGTLSSTSSVQRGRRFLTACQRKPTKRFWNAGADQFRHERNFGAGPHGPCPLPDVAMRRCRPS